MKEKKIIIVLIVCILVVIFVDIALVIYTGVKKDIRIKFSCVGSERQVQIENTETVYQEKNSYEFYITKNNELESGVIISRFIFNTEEDYNNFIEKVDGTSEEREKDYDKSNLKITYNFLNTFPNLSEENTFHFTESYLSQLEKIGFLCEKIG